MGQNLHINFKGFCLDSHKLEEIKSSLSLRWSFFPDNFIQILVPTAAGTARSIPLPLCVKVVCFSNTVTLIYPKIKGYNSKM